MSVPASLFIQPIVQRTSDISLPSQVVLSAQTNFSTIDSILAVNLTDVPVFVSVYISTGNFQVIPATQIPARSTLQLLKESYFSLEAGETLSAISDSSQNLFNINIEGRLFLELN